LKKAPSEIFKALYCDTSAAKMPRALDMARDMFGVKHLLWGSDWPANKDIKGSIQTVRDLGISEEEKEDILGGNLEGLFQ